MLMSWLEKSLAGTQVLTVDLTGSYGVTHDLVLPPHTLFAYLYFLFFHKRCLAFSFTRKKITFKCFKMLSFNDQQKPHQNSRVKKAVGSDQVITKLAVCRNCMVFPGLFQFGALIARKNWHPSPLVLKMQRQDWWEEEESREIEKPDFIHSNPLSLKCQEV